MIPLASMIAVRLPALKAPKHQVENTYPDCRLMYEYFKAPITTCVVPTTQDPPSEMEHAPVN